MTCLARPPMNARGMGAWWLLLLFTLGPACQEPPSLKEYRFGGSSMGTTFEVKVVEETMSEQRQEAIKRTIQAQLDGINAKMSTYLDTSEISRLNLSRETAPHRLSRETLIVLAEALRISEMTQGAFDVTVGPLVNAWGFGPKRQPPRAPTVSEIEQLKARIGWDKIELDNSSSTVRKLDPSLYLDLSAIAKGYAVDRLSEALSEMNFTRHMVELGGEVRTSGRSVTGRPWRIAIERPAAQRRTFQRILPLESLAMATSGDYRNFYQAEGVRISHTIDPRTGRPVEHELASVSVVNASCMRADGYATALMVLGETEGYRLASEQNWAALFLVRTVQGTFHEKQTPAFRQLFQNATPGTSAGPGAGS